MTRLLVALTLTAAVLLAGASGASGGPSPGVSTGSDGIASPGGHARYVAVTGTHDTVIEEILVGGGQVIRWNSVTGMYGIPLIAFDGQTGGLSRNGKRLVLSSYPGPAASRFVVLDTKTLSVAKHVNLRGMWSFDAVSPNGRTLFLIQYLGAPSYTRYLVRAYDLALGRLVPGAIVDKPERGSMVGSPVTRTTSADGAWDYTLYDRGAGRHPFIHALDTRDRVAVCIDLAWPGTEADLSSTRLTLSPDGRRVVLHRPGDGKAVMTVAVPGS